MALGEFALIERYFSRPTRQAVLGGGDDCALLRIGPGLCLATSTDLLVEGRHFLPTVPPERLGHKALAVNLSDLAACGARPLAFTLALSMPRVDEAFLAGFAQGLYALADQHACELVGGDTTQGPLTIGITVYGEVPHGQALLRSGARRGEDLYVSGTVGDARLALEAFRGTVALSREDFATAREAMEKPQPRVALGLALRGLASAAIDVSDGLLGDLRHVLRRSAVGARVEVDALPVGAALRGQAAAVQRRWALGGGDDYELLFTAPAAQRDAVAAAAARSATPVTRIGRIEADAGVRLVDAEGRPVHEHFPSFDHFAEPPASGEAPPSP